MAKTAVTVREAITRASGAYQQGQLGEAERLCRVILDAHADFFDALHLLAIVQSRLGHHREALANFDRALRLRPDNAELHYNRGVSFRALDRLDEAVASYDRAIALRPAYVEALINRGLSLIELKRYEEALTGFDQASALRPGKIDIVSHRAFVLTKMRRFEAALADYNRVLALEPDNVVALNNRGNLLKELNRSEEALASYGRAIALQSDYAEAYNNRGTILKQQKRYQEALADYDRALAIRPDYAEPLYNRGTALQDLKRFDEALASYDRALAVRPDYSEALNNRGNTLKALKRLDEALASYDRAIALRPDYAEAHNNRGNALKEMKRFEEALASYDRSLAARPEYSEVLTNRGIVLCELRRIDEALDSYARAIKAKPDNANAHWNEAFARLTIGDFDHGWPKYEWRWKSEESLRPRDFKQPLWLGLENLAGKTILLHAEQGLGDSIQFCRYAPLVAARGARVVLEIDKPLLALVKSLAGVSQIVTKGDPLPNFDFHCPLLSLPLAFGTRLDTIPATIPYLRVPENALRDWEERLGQKTRPRIGLAWSGNPSHKNDHNRSMSLRALLPLLNGNASFISLQKDVRPADAEVLNERKDIVDHGNALKDLADTGALISHLDLVITVDTSVAHLAGALGKPVWLLLPFEPDWRWMLDRDDSPWYPSARLFRQDQTRTWDGVVDRVHAALDEFLKRQSSNAGLTTSEAHRRATAAYEQGNLKEAEHLCRAILSAKADHFDALHLLAIVQSRRGRHADALESFDRALDLQPDNAELHYNRGVTLKALKKPDAALASYDRAIALRPDYPAALNNRGIILGELKRDDEALASYGRAIALRPGYTEALMNRGHLLKDLMRYHEALASYDQVIAGTEHIEALYSRGMVLQKLGRLEDALASCDRALAIDPADAKLPDGGATGAVPGHAEALLCRGNALKEMARYPEALASYDQAIALRPDYGEVHWNASLLRLMTGDYARGWPEYEWRWKCDDFSSPRRNFAQPQWRGSEEISGRTILLHAEQGLGDTIQFCRYASLAAARGARVVLEVHRPLRELMTSILGVAEVRSMGDPLPDFEFHCPLLSLPAAFGTSIGNIPSAAPYLRASAEPSKAWEARLGAMRRPRIGLAWAGNPAHKNDRNRSIRLSALLPLLDSGASFVSLQKDVPAADMDVLRQHAQIADHGGALKDFSDTAALIAQLDLVISVDSSVAHLAGALAKPVWVLLPFLPDWRWLLEREDSPWYPTAHLFRQDESRQWDSVVARVRAALGEFANEMKARQTSPDASAIPPEFRRAVAAYHVGKFAETEEICRAVLARTPDYFDGRHMLAVAQSKLGRKIEALTNFDRASALQPDNAEPHFNRGVVLKDLKRFEEAVISYDRAIALRSEYVEALYNRGNALKELNRDEAALANFDRALAVRPDYVLAHTARGNALRDLERYEEALASHDRALAIQSDFPEALNNRGITLTLMRHFEEALASYDRALALRPDHAEVLNNRGNVLTSMKRYDEALASYDRALQIRPDYAEAVNNRGVALMDCGHIRDALASYERAIALKPGYAQPHFNAGHCYLLLGDLERGWEEHEWRWGIPQARKERRNFAQPLWTGRETLDGKTILLHAEQGFGDTIQFCRYAPLVKPRGAHVILEVHPSLKRLLSELPGVDRLMVRGERLPPYDLHCPLLSLPRAFGTRLDTVPPMMPPLGAPPPLIEKWQSKLGPKSQLRVGIAWSGRPTHKNDHNRSLRLSDLLALRDLPVQLVSMQKELRDEDQATLDAAGSGILHFGAALTDFLETAALAAAMDVIISVDTSIAHLAASVGRPTWILLPKIPDWRWLLDREDSPWYPTARLFRQESVGDWDAVIRRVASALSDFAGSAVDGRMNEISA